MTTLLSVATAMFLSTQTPMHPPQGSCSGTPLTPNAPITASLNPPFFT